MPRAPAHRNGARKFGNIQTHHDPVFVYSTKGDCSQIPATSYVDMLFDPVKAVQNRVAARTKVDAGVFSLALIASGSG